MNYSKKYIGGLILFLLLLCFSGTGKAQMIKEFHNNKNDYFLDATYVLEYSSNKEYLSEGEDLLERFGAVWESGYFKPQHREKIYQVSNTMLSRTMRSYPHFYNFYAVLVMFVENKMDESSLELWLTELDTIGKQKSVAGMPDFLEYSYTLFKEKVVYQTRSRSWYFRNGGFAFDYDTAFFVYFKETDLVCSTGRDSMEITKTRGKYYIENQRWDGKMGRISWQRAGFHEDSVYAMLQLYNIDLKDLSFRADSAIFHNKHFFDFPVLGVFNEKVLSSKPGNRVLYPRFVSYHKDYEIEGFYKNVKYIGGIGMRGSRLECTGNQKETYAKFIFKKGGEYFALIRARLFEVYDDEIIASPAAFSIYFKTDSIYHSGLQMKYDHETKVLSLVRLNRGSAQSPFFNAFHNINMYCEALYWVMNSEEISFEVIRNLSPESRASFESDKYYSAFEYYKLQGMDERNPLLTIRDYSKLYGSNIVKVGLLADFIRKPVEQAIGMLMLLETKGFVVYIADRKEAFIQQRLYDYLDAHTGRIDYDVIRFDSHTYGKSNAMVELATFDMLIRGVPEIFLSDSQSVYIYPVNNEIVMKQNKDFTFSGRVRAGLFDFYATGCNFDYDEFRINMPHIDSMGFFVRTPDDSRRGYRYVRVDAVVEDMNGYILIDDPNNKSGLKDFPQYPIFTSLDNSFVYYDKAKGMEGVYNREDFYYELDPFTIDSLENFSTTGLRFSGYLSTGGILPPIEDELVVQEDFSLGVNSFTDENGLPLYGGKAMFYDTIRMDNSGLHGEGIMKYLTSVTTSADIDFFPDSVVSITRSFKVNKQLGQVEYADVDAGITQQYWYPDSNLMVVNMIDDPMDMFDNTAEMRGSLYLSPSGLRGRGDFRFERAMIESNDFAYGHHSMAADTSDFRLFTDSTFTEVAFMSDDYRANLDFDQRQGKFISSGVSSLVDMPFNKYICYMDELYWDMDRQIFELQNNIVENNPDINNLTKSEIIDLNLSGSDFISTVPEQDSLRFFSTKATYDIPKNIIYAEDVKIIRVADAAIFPDQKKLTILKDGLIETLSHAEMIIDTAAKYHHIYDASVNIFTRHDYAASGEVIYRNIFDEESPIYLSNIEVDSSGQSYGSAYLSDSLDFYLNPWYSFEGNAGLEASREYLRFDGSMALIHDCFPAFGRRFNIDTIIDPDQIMIPVPDSLEGPSDQPIFASLAFSPENEDFYPAFFTSLDREEDFPALSGSGVLNYNPGAETFTIRERTGDKYKEYLSLRKDNCVVQGSGPIEHGVILPYIDIEMFGEARHYVIPDSTSFTMVMGYDFFFDKELLNIIAQSINANNLPGADLNDATFGGFLEDKLIDGGATNIISELASFGTIRKIPEEISYPILFNHIEFVWNKRSSSYISRGDIGIFSVGELVVNRMVPGFIEIQRRPDGMGEVDVYLELPDGEWYYFNYRNYYMQAISSNDLFNDELMKMDQDKRLLVDKKEEMAYEFVISSRRKMVDFKRHMEEVKGKGRR